MFKVSVGTYWSVVMITYDKGVAGSSLCGGLLSFTDFISFFLNMYPIKMCMRLRPCYFIFIGYLKMEVNPWIPSGSATVEYGTDFVWV